jgi:hypothetical protein
MPVRSQTRLCRNNARIGKMTGAPLMGKMTGAPLMGKMTGAPLMGTMTSAGFHGNITNRNAPLCGTRMVWVCASLSLSLAVSVCIRPMTSLYNSIHITFVYILYVMHVCVYVFYIHVLYVYVYAPTVAMEYEPASNAPDRYKLKIYMCRGTGVQVYAKVYILPIC